MSIPEARTDAGRAMYVQKQRADIYTMLLILAFIALLVACLLLYLEMNAYDMQMKVPPELRVTQATISQPGEWTIAGVSVCDAPIYSTIEAGFV